MISPPRHSTRRDFPTLLVTSCLLIGCFAGCTTTGRISVNSNPPGARILIDGEDVGLKTPAEIELSTGDDRYTVALEKRGYNSVSRNVVLTTNVDPMTPKEAAGTILCAPCCLGLPLLNFLEPVKFEKKFVPGRIEAVLDPAGQGLALTAEPGEAEVYVDGQLMQPFLRNLYSLDVGEHDLEVRADGFRSFRRRVRVTDGVYQETNVRLALAGQGVIVRRPLEVPPGEGRVQILIDGEVRETRFDIPIRLEAGSYDLGVQVPTFRAWSAKIRVKTDSYLEIEPTLEAGDEAAGDEAARDEAARDEEG